MPSPNAPIICANTTASTTNARGARYPFPILATKVTGVLRRITRMDVIAIARKENIKFPRDQSGNCKTEPINKPKTKMKMIKKTHQIKIASILERTIENLGTGRTSRSFAVRSEYSRPKVQLEINPKIMIPPMPIACAIKFR